MSDLSITAANCLKSTGATTASGTAGETITAGMPVYVKSTDSKLYKAQCDGTAEEASVIGIALHGASASQPLVYQNFGLITIGATVAIGTVYVVSSTYGGIAPVADLSSTNYVSIIGIASSTTQIDLASLKASGYQKA